MSYMVNLWDSFSETAYRIGEIPKYLKDMKEKIAEKSRLDALVDPHCPPDHIALTDDERLEALDIAKKSSSMMPV